MPVISADLATQVSLDDPDPVVPDRLPVILVVSRLRGGPTVTVAPLDPSARTFVAGHRGMVGAAILRYLVKIGFSNVVCPSTCGRVLRAPDAGDKLCASERPDAFFLPARKLRGRLACSP